MDFTRYKNNPKNIDAIVAECEAAVERARSAINAKRCPKCRQIGHEVYCVQPAGFTGIYNCMNPLCRVSTFDPTMPEVI